MKQNKDQIILQEEVNQNSSQKNNEKIADSTTKRFGIIRKQDIVNDITSANLLEKNSSTIKRYIIASVLIFIVVLAIIGTVFLILMALNKTQ